MMHGPINIRLKCVFRFSLQLLPEIFLIPRRTERDVVRNICWSSCKVPVILAGFLLNFDFFSAEFCKNTQMSDFLKIHPMGAQFHIDGRTDGQTDMTKLIVAFCSFANAPKNSFIVYRLGSLKYKGAQAICDVPCCN